MIPLKTRKQKAILAVQDIIQRGYTLIEILDALEEVKAEIEMIIEAVRDDVEREIDNG